MNKVQYLLFVTLFMLSFAANSTQLVRYTNATDIHQNPNNTFFMLLLEEALQITTEQFGPFELQPVTLVISQDRQVLELNKGTFDVFWTMSTPARELEAQAIHEPIMKGAYGIRLLVIHKAYAGLFTTITTLQDLSQWVGLSGTDWPDTAIMRMNHLNVKTALFDKDLYAILRQQQAQYFPRGLFEAQAELQSRNWPELALQTQVVLRYPVAMKFFVARKNTVLAERLTLGLKLLKQNGRFDELFYSFPPHRETLEQLNLQNTVVLDLKSPFVLVPVEKGQIIAEQNALLQRLGANPR